MTRPLVVLQGFPRPTSLTNPFTVQLHDALAALPDVQVEYFTWSTALFGRYDVYHAHWPEILVGGRTPLRRTVRQARVLAFLLRLWVTRTALVRTVHNVGLPEGISASETWMLNLIERRTALRIVLNPTTPVPDGSPVALIPHPHYRDWFADATVPEAEAGRVGYIGRIRRYKGVEHLVDAFTALEATSPDLSLHISGYPSSDELADDLRRRAADDTRIAFDFRMLSDPELVDAVGRSTVVVLPYPHMHNSGAVLTALSLGRPVLVPNNPINAALAAEVGPGWVHLFDGALTSQAISDALVAVAQPRAAHPDLHLREWAPSARAHRDAFRRAIRS